MTLGNCLEIKESEDLCLAPSKYYQTKISDSYYWSPLGWRWIDPTDGSWRIAMKLIRRKEDAA